MPRHICFAAALFCAALFLAGCETAPAGRHSVKSGSPDAVAPKAVVRKAEDYSSAAVEKRTEAHAHYAAAVLHEWNDEAEPAVNEYFKAAMADPGNEPLVLEVSQRLLELKKNDQALELLLKATAESPPSGMLFARLGLLYSLLGKKELAIAANRTAIKKTPRAIAGYRHLARIYFQAGQYDDGLKVLEEAGKQSAVDTGFLVDLAELYASFIRPASGDTAKTRALECFTRAAQQKPANPLLLQRMADGFALLGNSEKAVELYVKLLERFPSLPGLREKLTELYLRKQDHKKAAEQLEELIRNNPTNPYAYYVLGNLAYEEQKLKEALEHFNKALLLNPAFEQAYYDLARTLITLNQPQDALGTLQKAHERFEQNFVSEFFTGVAYGRMKDFTNAIKHFEGAEIIARATDTNRLTYMFYFQLGSTYERIQKYDEAENYFKKCLALSPDFGEGLNYLGYMWADRGVHLTEARELIEKAVKLEPTNAAYLDSLGWVLFKMEKPQEALSNLLKAVEHSEKPDATLYDHLGDIYSSLHETEKAREAWRKALTIEPSPEVQKKLGAAAISGRPSP